MVNRSYSQVGFAWALVRASAAAGLAGSAIGCTGMVESPADGSQGGSGGIDVDDQTTGQGALDAGAATTTTGTSGDGRSDSSDGNDDGDGGGPGGAPKFDVAPAADLPASDDECAAVSEAADLVALPADIIFVVDNSGSMQFEASEVQARMNDFSRQIIDSGVDVRVVLISSYPGDGHGICIAPPLGAGGCPTTDNNPPLFTHVNQRVSSHNGWDLLLSTHSQWSSAVREESTKHVVIITDDVPNMTLEDFDSQFRGLRPDYADYVQHSVACHSLCPSAAAVGTKYIELSAQTDGVAADLCDQDFQAVFDVLSTEVIAGAALACEFALPPPPNGLSFHPDEVNLEFDDGTGGARLAVGRVDSEDRCDGVTDGWYYDQPDAPTMILLCPQTCSRVQDAAEGRIDIAFGCATIPAG